MAVTPHTIAEAYQNLLEQHPELGTNAPSVGSLAHNALPTVNHALDGSPNIGKGGRTH